MGYFLPLKRLKRFTQIFQHARWTMLAGALNLIFQVIIYFTAAQVIEPEKLGVYFFASSFIFIPAGIIEYSFTSSIISMEAPQSKDAQAVWTINLLAVLFSALLGTALIFLLQKYYAYESLMFYYLLMLPILFLMAFTSVQYAWLKKHLQMKSFAIIESCSLIVFFVIAMFLLGQDKGISSLIIGQLAKFSVASLILISIVGIARLKLSFKSSDLKPHLDFGKYIVGEKGLGVFMSYVDVFLVNHFFGAYTLGIYDLFKRMVFRPLLMFYVALEQVLFPLLTQEKQGALTFQKNYEKFTSLTSMAMLSLAVILISKPLLHLFPESYQGYSDLFNLIIIYATSLIVAGPIDVIAYSLRQTRAFLSWTLSYSIVQIVLMMAACYYGINYLIIVLILSNLIIYLLSYKMIPQLSENIKIGTWVKPALVWCLLVVVLMLINYLLSPGYLAFMLYVFVFLIVHYTSIVFPSE